MTSTTLQTFADASTLSTVEPGHYIARLDASWGQGRALFGGIQAALMVRGCETLLDDTERHLRTLSLSFCRAAVAGDIEVEARLERAGRYVSHFTSRLTQGGETVATALAVYARDRDDSVRFDGAEPPELPEPETLERLPAHPAIPIFTRHFDTRFIPGTQPYAGSDEPEVKGWLRFAERTPAARRTPLDAPAMAALLDVWPPAVLTTLAPPRASASVDLRYDILQPLPLASASVDDFYAFRCRILHWDAGHGIDEGELWTRDGRPVARIRQLRVIF
ncbi:MAG: thioesterase family protein [Acidobacteriota bacterium]